jgi:pteridine reductase
LACEGADVVVHHHTSKSEARQVVSEIEKLGGHAVALAANLADVSEINQLFQRAADHFGRLDILINSAANFLPAQFGETSEELWDSSLDTNLKAPFFCAQAAAPLLKKSRGVIINFADVGGLMGWPGYIPYSVSKAGVIMLTRCLAKAFAPEVRVNAIAPGTITMTGDPAEWEADYISRAPLRRSGRPQDVADAVVFLIQAKFMTGHVLVLDGGCSL